MSTYSKQQEARMRKQFEANGFKVIENTARGTQHRGDAILEHEYTGLKFCVDHKGTENKEGRRIERKQLEKIRKEATEDETPLLTVSYKGHKTIYVVLSIEDFGELIR